MTFAIDLPDAVVAALTAKARARGLFAEQYIRQVLERDVTPDWLRRSWDTATQAGLTHLLRHSRKTGRPAPLIFLRSSSPVWRREGSRPFAHTMDQIDAEIAAARQARRESRLSPG